MTMTNDSPTATETEITDGRVVGIAGPVVDVEFPRGTLPKLNTALEFTVQVDGKPVIVLAEVAQQLGDSRVRAICMKPTDGLTRGTPVRNFGHGIQVPVGDRTLGHVWNVWGDCSTTIPPNYADMERWDIHRDAPFFDALEPSTAHVHDGYQGHRPADAVSVAAARSACSVVPASARPC